MQPIFITLKLAVITTFILLIIGTPISWWLANTKSKIKPTFEALVALPLVLPPTVLGFYLLVAFNPNGAFGQVWAALVSDTPITFSFSGIVIGSVLYSLPFVVQPLQSSFESIDPKLRQAAATLGAKPMDIFTSIVLPLSRRGFLVAITLGFAHTIGEFGVVLMIGGNIPGITQVLSVTIYEHVEALEYSIAHLYSAGLLIFSFVVLLLTYTLNKKLRIHL